MPKNKATITVTSANFQEESPPIFRRGGNRRIFPIRKGGGWGCRFKGGRMERDSLLMGAGGRTYSAARSGACQSY